MDMHESLSNAPPPTEHQIRIAEAMIFNAAQKEHELTIPILHRPDPNRLPLNQTAAQLLQTLETQPQNMQVIVETARNRHMSFGGFVTLSAFSNPKFGLYMEIEPSTKQELDQLFYSSNPDQKRIYAIAAQLNISPAQLIRAYGHSQVAISAQGSHGGIEKLGTQVTQVIQGKIHGDIVKLQRQGDREIAKFKHKAMQPGSPEANQPSVTSPTALKPSQDLVQGFFGINVVVLPTNPPLPELKEPPVSSQAPPKPENKLEIPSQLGQLFDLLDQLPYRTDRPYTDYPEITWETVVDDLKYLFSCNYIYLILQPGQQMGYGSGRLESIPGKYALYYILPEYARENFGFKNPGGAIAHLAANLFLYHHNTSPDPNRIAGDRTLTSIINTDSRQIIHDEKFTPIKGPAHFSQATHEDLFRGRSLFDLYQEKKEEPLKPPETEPGELAETLFGNAEWRIAGQKLIDKITEIARTDIPTPEGDTWSNKVTQFWEKRNSGNFFLWGNPSSETVSYGFFDILNSVTNKKLGRCLGIRYPKNLANEIDNYTLTALQDMIIKMLQLDKEHLTDEGRLKVDSDLISKCTSGQYKYIPAGDKTHFTLPEFSVSP